MPMPTHVNGKVVKTGSWTPHEDNLLAEWQAKLGNRWSAVAKRILGRTGQQCAQRWRHKVNPNIRKEKWTEEEDEKLTELVDQYGSAWAEISRRMDGRTDQQCMGRWRRHLDPGIKRDAWKAREDATLMSLYEQYGSQWSAIAKAIPGRTAQQCRARWFQLESVDDSSRASASNRKPAPKPPSRSKPKRRPASREQGEDSDFEDEYLMYSQPRNPVARSRLQSVVEAEEDQGLSSDLDEDEEDISPPSDLSTPLKKAFCRAMNNSRNARRCPDGHTNDSTIQSADMHPQQHWIREAQAAGRASPDSTDAESDDEEATPGSDPSSGVRFSSRQSSELASPPFLSQEAHAHSMPSESELLNSTHYSHQSRSPSRRIISPKPRYMAEITPQRFCRPFAGGSRTRATPRTPLSGAKRSTPGGGFRPAEDCWETSPTDNVLHLFQSPQQGIGGRSNPLQSPSFQTMATPDWAKRDWLDTPETSHSLEDMVEDLPTTGKPLNRGPVARKLNIELALRGSAAAARAEAHASSPMHTVLQNDAAMMGRTPLCSPAKKFRPDPANVQDSNTPSRIQREHHQRMKAEADAGLPSFAAADVMVHIRTMTDKENSACNALKQLSMAALAAETSIEETCSAQTRLPEIAVAARVPSPSGATPGTKHEPRLPLNSAPAGPRHDAALCQKGSTQVRMRLHALLEDL